MHRQRRRLGEAKLAHVGERCERHHVGDNETPRQWARPIGAIAGHLSWGGWGKSQAPGRSPCTHCAGLVWVLRLKGSLVVVLRVSQSVSELSYVLSNEIFACVTKSIASVSPDNIAPRNEQVNGCVSPGPKRLGPIARAAESVPWTPPPLGFAARKQIILHLAAIFEMEKNALLLVPLKETSNDDPNEGAPGEKIDSVGQGGPQIPNMVPTKASTPNTDRTAHFVARSRRRCISVCSNVGGGVGGCWGGGVVVVESVFLVLGFLVLFRGFFTEVATVYLRKPSFLQ